MKKAFTLAEVLITLTIIGVIAALTIPNLMQKWSDHSVVVKLKEANSILSNAMKMAIVENGPVTEWGWPTPGGSCADAQNRVFFSDTISKYLKVSKYCDDGNSCGLGKNGFVNTSLNGSSGTDVVSYAEDTRRASMLLENGMLIRIWSGDGYVTNCVNGSILVDVNGISKPNKLGYDTFFLPIAGWQSANDNLYFSHSLGHYNFRIVDNCKDTTSNGTSCSYWVLRKENLDYKYRDVSSEW